jgi:hypothetical protein
MTDLYERCFASAIARRAHSLLGYRAPEHQHSFTDHHLRMRVFTYKELACSIKAIGILCYNEILIYLLLICFPTDVGTRCLLHKAIFTLLLIGYVGEN